MFGDLYEVRYSGADPEGRKDESPPKPVVAPRRNQNGRRKKIKKQTEVRFLKFGCVEKLPLPKIPSGSTFLANLANSGFA